MGYRGKLLKVFMARGKLYLTLCFIFIFLGVTFIACEITLKPVGRRKILCYSAGVLILNDYTDMQIKYDGRRMDYISFESTKKVSVVADCLVIYEK
jgi:hypothetical protein